MHRDSHLDVREDWPASDPFDALDAALYYGKAVLKTISPNDVGLTGSHQCGFYLPKNCWKLFTSIPPEKGTNREELVYVDWPGGIRTDSRVKWYGQRTRSEYRLTRFGQGFPFLQPEYIGDLLVLVPTAPLHFLAFVVRGDENVETVQAALSIPPGARWGAYVAGQLQMSVDACLDRKFETYLKKVMPSPTVFPSSEEIARTARRALEECSPGFRKAVIEDPDSLLLELRDAEYDLFQRLEQHASLPEIKRGFESIQDFLAVAQSILQRRKARAGKSLEHHVHYLLDAWGIPHETQPDLPGRPDIIIPASSAYSSPRQRQQAAVVALKTTCKDRWRQVLREAPEVGNRFLLTLQPGISQRQVDEIIASGIRLVVPRPLHATYEKAVRNRLLTLQGFLTRTSASPPVSP